MTNAQWIAGGADISLPLEIRHQVFVVEQGFSQEIERDAYDDIAWHVLVRDEGMPCATARLFVNVNGQFTLGRIAVLKEKRGQHLGDLLMRLLLFRALDLGAQEVHLGAQEAVVAFYQRFGFRVVGERYEEEGVGHRHMLITRDEIDLSGSCKGDCATCSACPSGMQ